MKILLFSYLFPNSKLPNRGIFNLSRAKALTNAGCSVIAVAPVSVNPNLKDLLSLSGIKKQFVLLNKLRSVPRLEVYEGIKVYHPKWITAPRKFFWKYLPDILHFFAGKEIDGIISEFKPDLIISTWVNPFSAYANYFKKYIGVKHFAVAEGSDVLVQPSSFKGWSRIEKLINENSDLVIAVSQKMKEQMEHTTGLKRIKLINNGYDENIFTFKNPNGKFAADYLKIVTVANFNYEKGHDILFEALRLLKIKFKLTLAGDGPLRERYERAVKEYGLQNDVIFLGQVPHSRIPELLAAQDLFCLPSRSEGFPAAPLEAMACGLPVVAADVGGMNEIITGGFNGYLFMPGSKEELAQKIMSASWTRWDHKEISEWVLKNFSWSAWAAKIIRSYDDTNLKTEETVLHGAVL